MKIAPAEKAPGLDDHFDRLALRRRVRRATLAELAGKLPSCVVTMEACSGAHHAGRLFAARGQEVRLMSPETDTYSAFLTALSKLHCLGQTTGAPEESLFGAV